MKKNNFITIEVAYANRNCDFVRKLTVTAGTTAQQAIEQSGVLQKFSEIHLPTNSIGIFSELIDLRKILANGDRVEIYRPLKIDPKQKRRLRANLQKKC